MPRICGGPPSHGTAGNNAPMLVTNGPRGLALPISTMSMGNFARMTIRWKVALVEDDRRLARAVASGLGEEGYTVRAVDSAARGLELVGQWNPDVVLLDLMLPDNDGVELFETFRAETDAALVGISAKSSVSDRIAGLKSGADDYVAKPFALEELMARVEAVIRRHRGKGGSRLVAGDVTVDLSEGLATRSLVRALPAQRVGQRARACDRTASHRASWRHDSRANRARCGEHLHDRASWLT